MMRYRFKSNHNVTLEPCDKSKFGEDAYKVVVNGNPSPCGELNTLLRHGIIEPIQEPRVIKGENRVVSTGIHSYQILPFLPEGTWDIEYTATEIL